MRGQSLILAVAPWLIAACAVPGAPSTIDTEDPATLAWVTPRLVGDPGVADADVATVVRAGEAFDLGVATQARDAVVVHFALDGAEVGACDTTDATTDCRVGDERLWTVAGTSAGHHALQAWFTRADGSTVRAQRALDVLAAAATPDAPPAAGAATEADPVDDTALVLDGDSSFDDTPGAVPVYDDLGLPHLGATPDAVADAPAALVDGDDGSITTGYLDPSHPLHARFGGLAWAVQSHRVVFAHASLDADVIDVANCARLYGASIARYADQYYVSRAALVGTAVAATGCDVDAPAAAHTGLMGLRAATCAALTAHDPTPLDAAACARQMTASPDFAIEMATRWLASPALRRAHASDPPLMAAAYATGAVAPAVSNRWHLFAPADATGTRDFVTAFVAAYNAYRTNEHTDATLRATLPTDGAPLMPPTGLSFDSETTLDQLQAATNAQVSPTDLQNAAIDTSENASVAAEMHNHQALLYHGGPVLGWHRGESTTENYATQVHIIWWGARWRHNTGRVTTIENFLRNIGHSSWFETNELYRDTTGQPVELQLGQEIHVDVVPPHGRWNRITDRDVGDIVYHAITSGQLPDDHDAIYLVLTDDRTRMPGYGTKFCGWHSYFTFVNPTAHVEYAVVGDAAVAAEACGDRAPSHLFGFLGGGYGGPHHDSVDGTMSVIAHELSEAVTDPLLNAWFDAGGQEIADKCAWNWGPTVAAGGGGRANLLMNNELYLIQQLWANSGSNGSCVMNAF